MALWTPQSEFQDWIRNDTARPAATYGTSITPGASNTMPGSFTEILAGASVTFDCYAVEIGFTAFSFGGEARDVLVDIGIDPSAGSSFATLIAGLQAPCASDYTLGFGLTGGIWYYFPIFIKAGTQIGARAQVNDNDARSGFVFIRLYGRPKHPELVRAGSYVTTFGANSATSGGVAVTSGTASEGAWTDLSGADTTLPYWYWQLGFGVNDSTMAAGTYFCDLGVGDGSNKKVVIEDLRITTDTNERVARPLNMDGFYDAPAGVRPYGRMQCSGTADSNLSMCAYGVGGVAGG